MSWGIDFKADVFLKRMSINNIEHLKDIIQEEEDNLKDYKEQIMMFVSSTPSDVIPDEWNDAPIKFLQLELNSIFEQYKETIMLLKDLYYYKEYLEDD